MRPTCRHSRVACWRRRGPGHSSAQSPGTSTPTDFFSNVEALRGEFAQLAGYPADNVAIVPSAGYGIAAAARNLTLNKGEARSRPGGPVSGERLLVAAAGRGLRRPYRRGEQAGQPELDDGCSRALAACGCANRDRGSAHASLVVCRARRSRTGFGRASRSRHSPGAGFVADARRLPDRRCESGPRISSSSPATNGCSARTGSAF